jgi:hypothetical protein
MLTSDTRWGNGFAVITGILERIWLYEASLGCYYTVFYVFFGMFFQEKYILGTLLIGVVFGVSGSVCWLLQYVLYWNGGEWNWLRFDYLLLNRFKEILELLVWNCSGENLWWSSGLFSFREQQRWELRDGLIFWRRIIPLLFCF